MQDRLLTSLPFPVFHLPLEVAVSSLLIFELTYLFALSHVLDG